MSRKTREVLLRSDRVLVGALAVILSVASAALGAAAADRPRTDEVVPRASVALEPEVPQPAVAQAAAPKAAAVAVAPAQAAAAVAPAVATDPVTAAPAAAPSTPADVALAHLLAEHRCLSEVLYYEARGEG